MAHDALDPGPNQDYPWFPRNADGTPAWSDDPGSDGTPAYRNGNRMPRGTRVLRRGAWSEERVMIDVTPRHPDGSPIEPPTIQPGV